MRRDNDVKTVLADKVSHAFTLIRERFTTSPRRVAAFGLVAVAGASALLHTSAATAEPLNTAKAAQVVTTTQSAEAGKSTAAKGGSTSKSTSSQLSTTKKATTPAKVKPTAGYNQTQMDNAAIIVKAGQELGISEKGQIIAVATAMQESNLYNLASYVVPESLKYAHQGTGADYDSVGLFQQRYTTGWGTVKEIMNPSESAKKFYRALQRVPGWQNMAVTVAAQTVQGSAFPDAYAKHQGNATAVVKAVNAVK
ncbi:MAG: hypothetical protein HOV77_08065 [Hamadaea sp.]|uniref:hypothetical protein n=1 Tax=Hamadaea sp. TaxID=2024425 RepID=UPI0017F46CED|nr:hypothetical protein [Hamadaea sp.]NUT19127.1 hypothetical protein [Hamadaea sp.]